MADLTITAADLGVNNGSVEVRTIQLGGTVAAGASVYRDSNGKYQEAGATDVTEVEAVAITIAGGSSDDYVLAVFGGEMKFGAILTLGEVYVVSATSGKIAPIDDLVSTNRQKILGQATSTSVLRVSIDVNSAILL